MAGLSFVLQFVVPLEKNGRGKIFETKLVISNLAFGFLNAFMLRKSSLNAIILCDEFQ